ncbi:unnamed protein product [Schistosoma guineensis]|nr:unnamed protein product [Schistosoma guineensis]
MLHNHPCSSSWMVFDPWTRRLSSEEKENLKPVILHCESADEVIENIKERTGKQVTAADVKGMKAALSTGCFTRKQVMDMLRQKGEVKEHLENGYATRICVNIPAVTCYLPTLKDEILQVSYINYEILTA